MRFGAPGPESAIIKLDWSQLTQSMPGVAMDILGSEGLLYDAPMPGRSRGRADQLFQKGYLGAPAASIASGTSEIMRGIIAMQVPRCPSRRPCASGPGQW